MATTVAQRRVRDDLIEAVRESEPVLRSHGIVAVYLPEPCEPEERVEFIVDYDPAYPFTLITLVEMEHRLGDIIGRAVEITTLDALKPTRREIALQNASRIF